MALAQGGRGRCQQAPSPQCRFVQAARMPSLSAINRSMSDSIDWTDDTPITLKEACELAFRGIVTEASLRAEHSRGMLEIFRIGRQDFTTLRAIREMI